MKNGPLIIVNNRCKHRPACEIVLTVLIRQEYYATITFELNITLFQVNK